MQLSASLPAKESTIRGHVAETSHSISPPSSLHTDGKPTSCKISAIALDLSKTWRDSILSNFLSKVSILLQDEREDVNTRF